MDTDVSRVMPPQEADAVSITSNSNNLWDSSSENTAETSDTESIFDDYLDEMMDQRRVSNTISSVDSVQDFSGDDSVSLLMFQIERAVSDLNAIQFSILDDLIYSAAGH